MTADARTYHRAVISRMMHTSQNDPRFAGRTAALMWLLEATDIPITTDNAGGEHQTVLRELVDALDRARMMPTVTAIHARVVLIDEQTAALRWGLDKEMAV